MKLEKYIDHTYLGAADDENAVEKLCCEAKKYGFHSVCVNPSQVGTAERLLNGSKVKICSVVDFPLGQSSIHARCIEAMFAAKDGADELDIVVNQRLLNYAPEKCACDLTAVTRSARVAKSSVVLKLILECCNLTKDEIKHGCAMAKKTGFDFVKTSTGFGKGGATVEDVKLMRKTVGKNFGVKAAGGIRTRGQALAMIEAGANRIGCSAGVAICTSK